jgi:hypothetical protein
MSALAIRDPIAPSLAPTSAITRAASPPPQGSSTSRVALTAPEAASPFAVVLRSLGREVEKGEGLVRSAVGAARGAGGGVMGPGELIALQAGVYRYGEAVDLASRLVDRATTSVKTVLQGQ